jgi:hypothetical protein
VLLGAVAALLWGRLRGRQPIYLLDFECYRPGGWVAGAAGSRLPLGPAATVAAGCCPVLRSCLHLWAATDHLRGWNFSRRYALHLM